MSEDIAFQHVKRSAASNANNKKNAFFSKKAKYSSGGYPSAASYCYNNTKDTHVKRTTLADDIEYLTSSLNALQSDNEKKIAKNLKAFQAFSKDEKAIQELEERNDQLTKKESSKLATLKTKLSVPRFIQTYEVVLLYDNREDRNTDLVNVLKKLKPGIVREFQLPVGDFILLLNGKRIVTIERKRTNDLCGSIKDSRLRKQTGNMELFHGGLTRIVLLIEKRRSGADLKCSCDHEEEIKENPSKPTNVNELLRQIDSMLNLLNEHLCALSEHHSDCSSDVPFISEHLHQLVAQYMQTVRSTAQLDLAPHCSDDLWWLFGDEESFDHEGTITRSHLIGSMVNRLLIQGMIPFTSESDTYSAFILLKMMNAMHNKGQKLMSIFANEPDFDLQSISKDVENLSGDQLKEFLATRQLPVIKDDEVPIHLTPSQRDFALQLRCLNKFTMDYVWIVVEKYPSPINLMKRMMECENDNDKIESFINEFSHIEPCSGGQRFGPKRAIDLYNHFMGTSYLSKIGGKNKPDRLIKTAKVVEDQEIEDNDSSASAL